MTDPEREFWEQWFVGMSYVMLALLLGVSVGIIGCFV